MRKLSAKWVPNRLNVDQKRQRWQSSEQLLEFFRRDPNNFLSQLVTIDETWLYHYEPETKQQSMEHSGSPHPKIFRVQKSAGKVLSSIFLGSRRHPLHWLSSKGPNYQRGVLFISAGAIEGHFEGKTPREGHQVGLVLARQCPGSPGTCDPEETGLPGLPMSWSPTLFSGYGPVGLPPVPWTEKKTIECSPVFVRRVGHCCHGDLGRTTFWIFLSGLQKIERANKCIELRGEYTEQIPGFVATACFLPGRAKDFSAPPRIRSKILRWTEDTRHTTEMRNVGDTSLTTAKERNCLEELHVHWI